MTDFKPLICVMVKNEERTIIQTLYPFISCKYVNFFIFDTGSEDNTVEKLINFSIEQKLNIIVKQKRYNSLFNYSDGRNDCLKFAKETFPNINWILMIDTDWYIENPYILEKVCKSSLSKSVYSVRITTNNFTIEQYRLFSSKGIYTYVGPVHERVIADTYGSMSDYISFKYIPISNIKTFYRMAQDLERLENCKDSRSLFYYAQTLQNLGKTEEAIESYLKRVNMEYNDEVYISLLRLSSLDPRNKIYYLNTAIAKNSERCEAYYYIAEHYSFISSLQYKYIVYCCECDKSNFFMSDYNIFNIKRWILASQCTNRLGKKEECINYCLEGMKFCYSNILARLLKKNNYIHTYNNTILNLILYSEGDPAYIKMKQELRKRYSKNKNIVYFFYTFTSGKTRIEEDVIYINGQDNYNSILEKTLNAIAITRRFRYNFLVRSNISTIIDFDLLDLYLRDFDYSGPLMFKNDLLNNNITFASGTCIVMSRFFTEELLKYPLNDDIPDDVSLGLFAKERKMKIMIPNESHLTKSLEPGYIAYRFKSFDRFSDALRMKQL